MYYIYLDTFNNEKARFNYLIVDASVTPIRFLWQPNLRIPSYATAWRTVATFDETDQLFTCDTIEGLLQVYTQHDNCIFVSVATVASLTDLQLQLPEHFI